MRNTIYDRGENLKGKDKCPKCLGVGEVLKEDHFGVKICPKCKGKGTLDWIENIMGVQGTYIKAGVYTREVDYSEYVTKRGNFKRDDDNDPWRFEIEHENNRE